MVIFEFTLHALSRHAHAAVNPKKIPWFTFGSPFTVLPQLLTAIFLHDNTLTASEWTRCQ